MSRKTSTVSKRGRGDASRHFLPSVSLQANATTTTTTAAVKVGTSVAASVTAASSISNGSKRSIDTTSNSNNREVVTNVDNSTTSSEKTEEGENSSKNQGGVSEEKIINLLDTIRQRDKVIQDLRSKIVEKDELIQRLSKALQTERQHRYHSELGYVPIIPRDAHATAAAAPGQTNEDETASTQIRSKQAAVGGSDSDSSSVLVLESSGNSSSGGGKTPSSSSTKKRKRKAQNKNSSSQENSDAETDALKQEEWDERIRQLKEYKEKYGTTAVPRSYKENYELVKFVETQRHKHKQIQDKSLPESSTVYKTLNPERIKQLEDMGFQWSMDRKCRHNLQWNRMYEALKEYKEKYGHTRVPNSYNQSLHNWVQNQRSFFKNAKQDIAASSTTATNNTSTSNSNPSSEKKKKINKLAPERIAQLQLLDFEWVVATEESRASWEARFQDLITFKAKYGHCRVPREFKDNRKLGNWVKEQRKNYKKIQGGGYGKGLTDERIRRLEEVGFEWRILQPTFTTLQDSASIQEQQMMEEVEATVRETTPTPRWGDDARTDASGPSRYSYLYENY